MLIFCLQLCLHVFEWTVVLNPYAIENSLFGQYNTVVLISKNFSLIFPAKLYKSYHQNMTCSKQMFGVNTELVLLYCIIFDTHQIWVESVN